MITEQTMARGGSSVTLLVVILIVCGIIIFLVLGVLICARFFQRKRMLTRKAVVTAGDELTRDPKRRKRRRFSNSEYTDLTRLETKRRLPKGVVSHPFGSAQGTGNRPFGRLEAEANSGPVLGDVVKSLQRSITKNDERNRSKSDSAIDSNPVDISRDGDEPDYTMVESPNDRDPIDESTDSAHIVIDMPPAIMNADCQRQHLSADLTANRNLDFMCNPIYRSPILKSHPLIEISDSEPDADAFIDGNADHVRSSTSV